MKRFLLSYDINAGKCTEREIWDALYEIDGLTIVDKPVLSTLLLESEEELMHQTIELKLREQFKDSLYFVVCRIDERKKENGQTVYCIVRVPNPESQKQIQEYLVEKQNQKKIN